VVAVPEKVDRTKGLPVPAHGGGVQGGESGGGKG
jgi:hypothetical protein